MKNIKTVILLFLMTICLGQSLVSAAAQYQEIDTSQGKVIVGLDREKAFQMFGPPASKGDGLWYYSASAAAAGFFVSFSAAPSILLYPSYYQSIVGVPLEFRAFLNLPDSGIKDVTKQVQLVFDRPECAKLVGTGVIVPKKTGEYSALAIYNEVLSNPINMQIKEPKESGQKEKEKEKLLSIDLLPYRPRVVIDGAVDFVALGTFYNYDLNEYSVRDISQDADWSIRQRPKLPWNRQANHRLYFPTQGQAEVLSEYKGSESFLARVEVKNRVDSEIKRLKHILVLPEVMIVLLNSNINLRAFGTYNDNWVEELIQGVKWKITEPGILGSDKNGYFLAKAEGTTEIIATKDGVESLPIKVVVVNNSAHFFDAGSIINSGKENAPDRNALESIKDNVEKLKKEFSVKKKELKQIQITPKSLEIGLGEEAKLAALGIYDDGSSSDLTILGSWGILDKDIATVSSGNVVSVSLGQSSVYVEFKGVRSEYVKLVVGGPRLVSILLTPLSVKIPRDGRASFEVQGNYYDHSQRILTQEVSWGLAGPAVVKIENGVARPLKFGQTEIYAEYSRLRSNTASIDVILTLGWALRLLAKLILALLLGVIFIACLLYLLVDKKRRQLRSLKSQPRELILGLHENAIRLISIFGLRYNSYTFPLLYAELARQRFKVENNVFLNFSIKFEEAKYSQHALQDSDLAEAVNDYNHFFEQLCKNQSRMLCFYRYALALVCRRPIFIFSASEAGKAK